MIFASLTEWNFEIVCYSKQFTLAIAFFRIFDSNFIGQSLILLCCLSLSIQINAALKLSELKLLNSATKFRIVMIYSGFFFLVSWFFHSHFQLVKRNAKKYSRYLNSFNGTCKKFLFRPSRFHAIRVFVTFVEQL